MTAINITLASQTKSAFATRLIKHLESVSNYYFSFEIDEDNEMPSSKEWQISFSDEYGYSEQGEIEDMVQEAMEDLTASL